MRIVEGLIVHLMGRDWRVDTIYLDDEDNQVSFVGELLDPQPGERAWEAFRIIDPKMVKVVPVH